MYKLSTVPTMPGAAEPGVITRNILVCLAIDQGPKKEAGRLFLQDGLELDKLKEIRIEFLNILNIDYLWPLKNLVKLSLSHNIIERIENLDDLVCLKELDLSFNRIKVLENLNHLDQLEILLLFSNEISIVQGIDYLKKLTILNIGKNKIADWKHVIYLRNLKGLRSFNMRENPCAEIDGYMDYVLAFIPQLIYYEYKMISESMRQAAVDKHYRVVSSLEENEAKKQAELMLQQKYEKKVELLSECYVEYLDDDCLFQQMFASDEGGRILITVTEDSRNTYEKYKKSFSAMCEELCELGSQEHKKRMEEIKLFELAVNEGKENAQNESRKIVDEVIEKKTEIFANIKNALGALIEAEDDAADDIAERIRELFNKFNSLLYNARNQLMSKEFVLHNQMEEINDVLKINMTDMVNSFLDNAREIFSRLRNVEAEYNETINSVIRYYLDSLGDDESIPARFIDVYGDKETLDITLAASHDMHLQVIDNREDRMMNRLNNWLKEYIDQLIVNENKRNRRHILEISHFLGLQQEEFNLLDLPQQFGMPDIDLNDVDILEN